MSSFRLILVGAGVLCLSFLSQNAFGADNGVLKLELADAVAASMGGAFVGEADRPSAVYYNPAGIVQMDSIEALVNLTWLQPQIHYESSAAQNGPGYTANMKEDNYIFPAEFVTAPVIKGKLYVGLGETSNFGSGFDWEADSFSRYDTVKDSTVNKDYTLVAAYKITDQWSVGLGAVDDDSKSEHDSALYQAPGADGDALFKANDTAWGFTASTLFRLNNQNQFGLVYRSPIQHKYDGTLYLNNLNTSNNDYEAIFGGTSFATKAIYKSTLPQSVTLGYSAKPLDKLTVNFDLEWTDWTRTKQQTTFYPYVTNPGQQAVLGTGNPQARQWHSVWAESVGAQYALTDNFRIRLGYGHHQTPIPESTLDTEFYDSDYNAVAAGLGYDITPRLTVDLAYIAVFYESRNVVNTVDNVLGAFLNGKYSEFINLALLSLKYKF